MRVSITKEDINAALNADGGLGGLTRSCPIAQATGQSVGLSHTYVIHFNDGSQLVTDPQAVRLATLYDAWYHDGRPRHGFAYNALSTWQPFEFDTVPDEDDAL